MTRLAPGKVPWDLISAHVRGATGADVALGPAAGEDAALVRIGGELWAVASDPISFTADDAGRLAVIVNANDVAVMGAEPRFFVAVLLMAPSAATTAEVERLLGQIRAACERLGVALIGGHTEVTPGLEHSLVVGTMLGRLRGRPLRSGGLEVGDRIGMSKWAGLEGTAILLAEHGERLRSLHGARAFRDLEGILSEDWLSVVPEATVAAGIAGVHALHDVTEGGVGEALHELARASGVELEIEPDAIPMLDATRLLAEDFRFDALGLIGSGALLVGCAEDAARGLARAYAERGIPFAWIGRAAGAAPAGGGSSSLPRFARDEILKTRWLKGIEAVIFDMDGTLVDSRYDWPAIRAELGVGERSLIDALNGLAREERQAKWRRLEEIEHQATAGATLADGAIELLALLRERGVRTALVTNNSRQNTASLLHRFGLSFDLVLTRDDGLWKPSGAPVAEAIRRLGVPADRCLKVGDSSYDVAAAREAGCGRVAVVHDPGNQLQADLSFPHVRSLERALRLAL